MKIKVITRSNKDYLWLPFRTDKHSLIDRQVKGKLWHLSGKRKSGKCGIKEKEVTEVEVDKILQYWNLNYESIDRGWKSVLIRRAGLVNKWQKQAPSSESKLKTTNTNDRCLSQVTIFQAEIYATREETKNCHEQRIHIYSDSQATLRAIQRLKTSAALV